MNTMIDNDDVRLALATQGDGPDLEGLLARVC